MPTARHIYIAACAVTAMALSGCQDMLEDDWLGQRQDGISASIVTDTASRTVYIDDDTSVKVEWEAGDAILVCRPDMDKALRYTTPEGGATARFEPKSASLQLTDGETVNAIYPATYNYDLTGNSIPIRENFSQYLKNGPGYYDVLAGSGVVANRCVNLQFRHLMAIVRITIKTDLLPDCDPEKDYIPLVMRNSDHDISVVSTNAGPALYDFDTGTLDGTRYSYLWVNIPAQMAALKETITFYVAVLPCEGNGTLSIGVSGQNPIAIREITGAGLQAGHVYRMGIDVDEGAELELRQREILTELYNMTDGPHWERSDNWCTDRPLNEWYGIWTSKGVVTDISLAANRLQGQLPESLGELKSLTNLFLDHNSLSGPLPESLGNIRTLKYIFLMNNYFTGTIPASWRGLSNAEYVYLYANQLSGQLDPQLTTSDTWASWNLNYVLCQRNGYRLTYDNQYHSTDYSANGTVEVLATHTRGAGIPFVILPECYTDVMIASGAFRQDARAMINEIFKVEPYASHLDLFDFYLLNVVSPGEWLTDATAFDTRYELTRNTMSLDYNRVKDYVRSMSQTSFSTADVTSIVLFPHFSPFRSVCYMSMSSDHFAAAMVDGPYTGIHEALGHGFGKLADEYVEYCGWYSGNLQEEHAIGFSMNVDTESSCSRVIWSDLLANPDYAVENLGVYEGAYYYPYGVYRSSEKSIMNSGGEYPIEFNAPSRRAIYRRMMQLAGIGYTDEGFLEYDKLNLERLSMGATAPSRAKKPRADQPARLPGAPPVFVR